MRIVSSIKPPVAARLGLTLLIVPIYFVSTQLSGRMRRGSHC
jgi:hypothetical protein